MRILDRSVYVGPSLYARFPVIRLELELGELEGWPTGRLGAPFVEALASALPGLAEHGCSYREPGGFFRRMREGDGTWLGHVLEHVAIELQNIAGEEVTFGKTRSAQAPGVYTVVYEYVQRDEGIAAGELGLRLLSSLLPDELRPVSSVPQGWDWAEARDQFIRFAQRRALGPSTASLVRAAEARGIPWLRLNDQSLVQLGHGKFQQRIQATVTGRTPHIAVELASDKEETNKILAGLGLPVPQQELVQSDAQAVRAARRIGFPVVTKPYNGNHGRGISIRLTTEEEVAHGFAVAREHSRSVIVETFLEGDDHRLLVVNGELVAATRRTPGHVVGDGEHTVAQLIDIVNLDPRRGVGHEKVLTRLELDAQAQKMLERAGLTANSVPAKDVTVYLRSTANLSTGGTATDVTDVIHPDNREMAERAVRAIGLDVGGVDFLSKNITESYRKIGGGICEVNAAPGFRMHVAPSEGTARDVAAPVIDMLFPPGAAARVPIAAITGTNGKTTTARMLAHITKMAGYTPGLTTTDGVYIDGQRTVSGDMTGPVSARMVLADPQIDIAVLETARGGLLRAGMGVNEVNVGAVLNVQPDHLGLKGIDTLEQLAEVKRIVVEVATDCAVLNADDPLVLRMSGYTEAKNICYVTLNPRAPAGARAHPRRRARVRARGGRQRPDDHPLRQERPHTAAVDSPDPGDARGARHAQRAERDVRRGDGVLARHQAGGDPPGPAHLRLHVLPGPGTHERLQRASLQGAVRLRAQRARGRGHGRPGAAARRPGPAHRGAGRSRRPPRRGSRRHRARGGRPLRPLHLPARRQPARAQGRRGAAHPGGGTARRRRGRARRSPSFPTSRRPSTPRSTWDSPAICC